MALSKAGDVKVENVKKDNKHKAGRGGNPVFGFWDRSCKDA